MFYFFNFSELRIVVVIIFVIFLYRRKPRTRPRPFQRKIVRDSRFKSFFCVSRHPPSLFNLRVNASSFFLLALVGVGVGWGLFVAQVLQVPHIVSHQLHPARRSVSRVRSALRGSPRGEAMGNAFENYLKVDFWKNWEKKMKFLGAFLFFVVGKHGVSSFFTRRGRRQQRNSTLL